MKMLVTVSLALVLTVSSAALAQDAVVGAAPPAVPVDGWSLPYTWESVHFTLHTDIDDEVYARGLQDDMERFFSKFQKEYWDLIRPQYREAHITVASVGTQEAFDLIASGDAGIPPGEKGYSNRNADRIAFLRQDEYYKDVMIVVHELAHVFNRFSLDAAPLWLDEGMAQYYANYAGEQIGNTFIRNGVSQESVATVMNAADSGTIVPLPALFKMTEQEYHDANSQVHYAQSWSLVYYLRRGVTDGENRLAEYYAALAKKTDPAAAFNKLFGADTKALEADWLAYNQSLQQQDGQSSRKRTFKYVVPNSTK